MRGWRRPRRTVAALLVGLATAGGAAGGQVLDSITARVGPRVITWSRLLQEAELQRLEGRPETMLGPEAVRESLVRRELLLAEAERLRLTTDAESVARRVASFVEPWGEEVWERLAGYGVGRSLLEQRARRQLVVEEYLSLRREMTFVPEAEVRAFYGARSEEFGGRPLLEVRDEVRSRLAEDMYQRELDLWIDRQIQGGAARLNPLPEG